MENKDLKILAVDDIYDNLITIKALILETFPYAQVVFALSGSEALQLAERMEPDIILLDVVMPDMDGFEVCKALKADENLSDIPVVFITALKGDKESRIRALEVGAEAFLAKPVDESELVAQIRAMSKIRHANLSRKNEQEQLNAQISEKTMQLELNNVATLNLLEDLQKEIDARRKTEAELLKSEAKLRRAELASKSGNWEYDPDNHMFYFSEGAAFVLGFTDSEVPYESFFDLLLPEFRSELSLGLKGLILKGVPFNTEIKLIPKGYSEAIDLRIFAVSEKNEKIIFGVLRNITEQKKTTEKLIESENLYRAIIDASPDNILIADKKGNIQMVSPQVIQTMGYDDESEIVGRNFLDIVSKEEIPRILNDLKNVDSENDNSSILEYKCVRKDGKVIDIEAKGGLIYDINNEKSRIVIVARDISDRKKVEEKIIRSEAEYRSVWENSVNALRLTDENGVIVRANKSFCKLFEISEDDVVGKLMSDLYFKTNESDELEKYKYKFANKILDRNSEKEIVLWNSIKKWVEIDKTFLELSSSEKLLLTVFNEITTRKKAQDELHAALERNRALLYANPDQMFLFSSDYKIIDYKAEGELYSKPNEFLHQTIDKILPEKIAAETKVNIDTVLRNRTILHHNYDLEIDGVVQSFEARYVPCENDVLTIVRDVTASVKTQRALAESEAKYRDLMDNSPEGITIYVDGKIAYINREAMNVMRAKDKSELIGRTLFEFIHPDNVALIMERMQFVALTPLNVALPSVEEKYLRLDGTEVYVEIKVMPIIFDGKPAVQISGHDITEKKKAREELEKNRKELKTIYDNAPVMMCVVNEKAEILFSNTALNTFIDNPAKLTEGITTCGNVFGCIHSLEKPEGCGFGKNCNNCVLRHALVDTFKSGEEHKDIDYQTYVLREGVGKYVSLLASTSIIQSEGEKRLLLCMVDITARKEAEIALNKSEMLLRTFIENIPFGVWARDMNNVAIIQNAKLTESFGSLLGTDVNDSSEVEKSTVLKWAETNKRAFAGEIINEEVEYVVHGVPVPFQNIVFPIRSDEEIFGIAGININISDRIKAQKELLDYQQRLKDFAAHLQTVREEERINLAREIHDDLGQILVAIKFDLGMLGAKSKKYIREDAVEEFTKQFKRMEGYVNNTIKSARRIMTDLRPELLDMVGLVEAFNEHIKAFNERQPIKCEFINKTTTVSLSPEKAVALFRILQESLNNASKYSEATSITVELGCSEKNTYLEIIDNGIGFDLALKKRSDSYGLTGMKERAYLLEGSVDIWSEPGKGVKIRVDVPEK